MKRFSCVIFALWLVCSSLIQAAASEVPEVESKYVYVYNLDENRILYEKDAHKKMYPASMTKMMTVLVALDQLKDKDMEEVITFTPEMLKGLSEEGASVVGYSIGNQARIIDLLYGILLPSGADASRAIAIHLTGSEKAFVDKMNEKAKELKLENTHFVNTSGLHNDDHYSTAADMAKILETGLKNASFEKIFTSESYEIGTAVDDTKVTLKPDLSLEGTTLYSTKLTLMKRAGLSKDIIKGSKTGYTLEGGLCMASIADHDNAHYLIITGQAGSDAATAQNMKDAYTLYDYLFQNYERKLIYPKDKVISKADLIYGKEDSVGIKPLDDIYLLVEKDNSDYKSSFQQSVTKAPVAKGEVIGDMSITYQGEERQKFNVVATKEVSWSLVAFLSFYLFDRFLILPLILIIAIVIILMIRRRNIRRLQRRRAARMMRNR